MTEPARKRKRCPRTRQRQRPRENQRTLRRETGLHRFWTAAQAYAEKTGYPAVKGFFGSMNPYPFSNHAIVPTIFKGVLYRTAEHAYLAEQARAYGRNDLAEAWTRGTGSITEAGRRYEWANPKQVKAYSTKAFRQYRNPNLPARKKWLQRRVSIMFQIVMSKYLRSATARAALLRTGHAFLVESSPHDDFWGIGAHVDTNLHAYDGLEHAPTSWGQNRLGLISMGVRNQLLKRKHRAVELRQRAKKFLVARALKRGTCSAPSGTVRKTHQARMGLIPREGPTATADARTLSHFSMMLVPGIASATAERKQKLEFQPLPPLPQNLHRHGGKAKSFPYRIENWVQHSCITKHAARK